MEGKNARRLADNPLERSFADAWARYNKEGKITEYLLTDSPLNHRQTVPDDVEVDIATMMQWLGSPVGQGFLEEALGFDIRNYLDLTG